MIAALEKAEAIRVAENHQSFLDGVAKVAKSLIEDGEPIEKIKKHTGLSENEIRSLKASVKYQRI